MSGITGGSGMYGGGWGSSGSGSGSGSGGRYESYNSESYGKS